MPRIGRAKIRNLALGPHIGILPFDGATHRSNQLPHSPNPPLRRPEAKPKLFEIFHDLAVSNQHSAFSIQHSAFRNLQSKICNLQSRICNSRSRNQSDHDRSRHDPCRPRRPRLSRRAKLDRKRAPPQTNHCDPSLSPHPLRDPHHHRQNHAHQNRSRQRKVK